MKPIEVVGEHVKALICDYCIRNSETPPNFGCELQTSRYIPVFCTFTEPCSLEDKDKCALYRIGRGSIRYG